MIRREVQSDFGDCYEDSGVLSLGNPKDQICIARHFGLIYWAYYKGKLKDNL